MTSTEKMPGTHKAKGVMVADTEEVAETILTDYAASIRLDLSLVTPRDWQSSVRIACGETAGQGIDEAKNTLAADRAAQAHQDAKQRRTQLFTGDYNALSGMTTNTDAEQIFEQCYEVAVSGEGPNFTFGRAMKRNAVDAARVAWEEFADTAREHGTAWIHNFHSYPPTNKAEQNKGNVGATLDKRKVQADFLVYFGGRKINAHVDVKD